MALHGRGRGRGFLSRVYEDPRLRAPNTVQTPPPPAMGFGAQNQPRPRVFTPSNQAPQNPTAQVSSGIVRRHANRNPASNVRGRNDGTNSHGGAPHFDRGGYRRPPLRPDSATSATSTESSRPSSGPHITYSMLTRMLPKQPDEILSEMLNQNFPLAALLNDQQMRSKYEWTFNMTKLLEKLTTCDGARERVAMILKEVPRTAYLDGVYEAVRGRDVITDELRYEFLQSFLKMSNKFLSLTPYCASDLTKIFERIELAFTKTKSETQEFLDTKAILDEVLERANELEKRTQRQKQPPPPRDKTTAITTVQHDIGPPPDDYRMLPIVPDVREILSEQRAYLRENIVNGVYQDPLHYLDVHFRLLREDFVGPLREGIQQYLSGEDGKNFNVRIYENVRSYGPRLSPRSGIVFDLLLDAQTASKISWANSRRLMFGNLLILTYDRFQTCAFVTVEDRTLIQKDLIISVRTLDNVNNVDQRQIDLESIDFSYSLTMIETMTYFEAYRPVLNALQMIAVDETFPLEPFLLKLSNEKVAPDYITEATTYDFTPLLVDPKSEVRAGVVTHELEPAQQPGGRYRGRIQPLLTKEFRLTYKQSRLVPDKYKSVPVLDTTQWPTSDELHLNPKQHEALILALTQKVALIQGPPGTGKTYLGVRITEMLLHNRAVWCPAEEQSTPILMICHTNHALDQFLELVKTRLNLNEGIIRVGNRCQNEAIRPFSLMNARKFARDNRSIPREIYHQKHTILDRKTEVEESLKIHGHQMEQSRTMILPLSAFNNWDIIDQIHLTSLLAPYQGEYVETALFDWLGLGHGYASGTEEVNDLIDGGEEINQLTSEENAEKEPSAEEGTEKIDADGNEPAAAQANDTAQEVTTDANQQNNDDNNVEMNEEEEEEQRRRDEIELDDDYIPSAVTKPQATTADASDKEEAEDTGANNDGWRVVKKKPYNRRRLTQMILRNVTTLTDETAASLPADLWQFTAAQRHDLYRYWLLKYQQYCHYAAREAREEYHRAVAALAEYHQAEDYFLLKDSVIVAMTTTCAAKYHTVLERLQSKIVIVEEAAAIFEAHIITALSTKCEHLILIGDHVQLRPNPSVYRLAVKYHIDVSLFERFINNKFPNVRLNIQHRMRPEIARLMKHFYDDLDDHISVKTDRPGIRAVESSLYFINHTHPESTVADGSSKRNDFEANYAIQFAQYLVKQGYRPDQITVLVMYLGQRQLIARQAKAIKLLQGMRIMVTDNYQGEENDIIILSLVRSNADKQIGFLKIPNRICVALSRARCGLFILGNMKLMSGVDDMWRKISKSLLDNNEIGRGLSLSCRQHSTEKFIADTPGSFGKRPEGGCDKACIARLACGHQCDLMCHNYDVEHIDIVCRKTCNEILGCDHRCMTRCHAAKPNQHDPCRVLVEKTIVGCGHQIRFQCAQTPTVHDCKQPILKRLACDHTNQIPCSTASFEPELKRFSCTTSCNTTLACTHKCVGTCGRCRTGQLHIPCQEKCGRSLICSHVCKAPCAVNCPPCNLACETRCVHSQCKKKCGEPCTPCKERCEYKCKHLQCTRLCSEPCNRGPCNQPCEKKLKCGHDCIGICGEPCPTQCRICNRHVVQEIFFGSEDEPDARFVLLPDCKHLVEVTALDKCIFDGATNSDGKTAIRFPECPRCRHPVRRCTRYMPMINQVQHLIEQVKAKILGGQSEQQLKEKKTRVIKEYEKTEQQLKEVDPVSFQRFFSSLLSPNIFISPDFLIMMENTLAFIGEIDHLLSDGRKKLPNKKFEDLIQMPLANTARYVLTLSQYRNFAAQQIQDIQRELERFRRLIFIETINSSLEQQRPPRELKQNEKDAIATMQHLTTKSGQFTEKDGQIFDGYKKQLEHLDNLPGLGINERERKAIVSALSMGQGHWYVCPQGHPYVITECGGANQESTCPECGERIGGQNHQLLTTNRHFGLMDGSQHAAWSDAANLDVGLPLP